MDSMQALGIDLSERSAVALVIDESGRVIARSVAEGGEAGAVAHEAISGQRVETLGVASVDGTTLPPGLEAITPRVHPFAAGAAAVVAEVWIGAARGASHAIT